MSKVSLNTPASDFELIDFRGQSHALVRFPWTETCAAGFQPRFCLTVLPSAYGAVAPGLPGI